MFERGDQDLGGHVTHSGPTLNVRRQPQTD